MPLKKSARQLDAEIAEALVGHAKPEADMRCTEATLRAFGIEGVCPITGLEVTHALTAAGYKWRVVGSEIEDLPVPKTVRRFAEKYPRGCFYISTNRHAMALTNGKLTDTTARGLDKRKIQTAFMVDCPRKR